MDSDEWLPIIFLDIDGVLNAHEFDRDVGCSPIDRDKVEHLNRIIRATDARIVLSSAWRYICIRKESDLIGFGWLLASHGMMGVRKGKKVVTRLVGITGPDTIVRGTYEGDPESWPLADQRGRQIANWMAEFRPGCAYVVIDDGGIHHDGTWTDLGIGAAGHPFVRTVGTIGLTEAGADQAIGLLRQQSRPITGDD